MNREHRIARALNDTVSSNFSRRDTAALSDFLADYFDTDSLHSKYDF